MNKRLLILGAAAITAGLVTALLARNWLDNERRAIEAISVPSPIETRSVLVARRNLPVGSFIKSNDLKWQDWPAFDIPGSFLTKSDASIDEFVGAVIRVNADAGQPVSHNMVVLPGERGFMAAVLKPGSQAVSIPVSATTGISGFVFPGDRVDILLTHSIEDRQVTELLLEDIRILAVDQRSDTDDRDPIIASTVTLQVTPKEAKIISVAGSLGQLSLSLRSLFGIAEAMDMEQDDPDLEVILDENRKPIWDYEISDALQAGTPLGNRNNVQPVMQSWNVEVIRGPATNIESF